MTYKTINDLKVLDFLKEMGLRLRIDKCGEIKGLWGDDLTRNRYSVTLYRPESYVGNGYDDTAIHWFFYDSQRNWAEKKTPKSIEILECFVSDLGLRDESIDDLIKHYGLTYKQAKQAKEFAKQATKFLTDEEIDKINDYVYNNA